MSRYSGILNCNKSISFLHLYYILVFLLISFLHLYSFQTSILNIIKEESDEASLQEQRDLEYRKKVISSFFVYGKLKSIPDQRKKKLIVLEVSAEAFEKGRFYTEREVNIIIADFHDDFCTLQKDMIDEGLLDRDSRGYWQN